MIPFGEQWVTGLHQHVATHEECAQPAPKCPVGAYVAERGLQLLDRRLLIMPSPIFFGGGGSKLMAAGRGGVTLARSSVVGLQRV